MFENGSARVENVAPAEGDVIFVFNSLMGMEPMSEAYTFDGDTD